ncbi:MAG: hypothetical protein QOI37_1727 [Chloroflexota bacterium]|nr:hypothetical protein [Chloroflexota bacterium]
MTSAGVAVRLVATAAPHQGRGHLNRALAVGEALARLDVRSELDLVRGRLTTIETERAREVGIELLAQPPTSPSGVAYVDLPDPNEAAARAGSARTAVMDDLDRFTGRAALVIQPSRPRWTGSGRAGRVLEGFGMVPIAAVYRRLRTVRHHDPVLGQPPRVVACFGGSDPARVSERLMGSLIGDGWRTDLILGAAYGGLTDRWPIEPVRDPADLPERMAAADLLVLAAGTMKFEAACLGRPALLLAVADDQLEVGPSFAATGAATYLGDGRTVSPEIIHAEIAALLGDQARLTATGIRAAEVVDGQGADRIAGALVDLLEGADR